MAVAFQTHTTAVDTSSPDTISVNPPSGLAAGDLWVIHVAWDYGTTEVCTAPVGWTKVPTTSSEYGSGDNGWQTHYTLWKVAAGGDVAVSIAHSEAGTFEAKAVSMRFDGQHATPIDVAATPTEYTGAATTIAVPSATATNDGSMAISIAANDGDGGTGFSPPATVTEIAELPTGNGFPLGAVGYTAVNAGSYNPGSWTAGSDDGRRAQTIIIAPAAVGGSTVRPRSLLTLGCGA